MPTREWIPSALAALLAALMIWLARAPFAAPASGGELTLLVPRGELREFPRRFAWSEVDGATGYEVFVAPTAEGAAPLFRQRGAFPVLDLEFEADAEPPPGDYVWEVRALREGRTLASASASFSVGSSP